MDLVDAYVEALYLVVCRDFGDFGIVSRYLNLYYSDPGVWCLGTTDVAYVSHGILWLEGIEIRSCGAYLQLYIGSQGGYLLSAGSMDGCECYVFIYSVLNFEITLLLYCFLRVPNKPKAQRQPTGTHEDTTLDKYSILYSLKTSINLIDDPTFSDFDSQILQRWHA